METILAMETDMVPRILLLLSFHMSGPDGDEISQQHLASTEHTVVEELRNWLIANPNAEWKQSPRFKLVEQCSEASLREILQRLAQVCCYRAIPTGACTDYCRILVSLPLGLRTRDGN